MAKEISIGKVRIGNGNPLVIIAGPCVVESRELALKVARDAKKITEKLGLPYIYKSSYKKANRTSAKSFVGIGMDQALKILDEVKRELDLPILTDIHSETEVEAASEVADVPSNSGVPLQTDRSFASRRKNWEGCKYKEGPIHGA